MVQVLGHGTGEHAPGYTGQGTLVYQVLPLDIDISIQKEGTLHFSNLDEFPGTKNSKRPLRL